MQKHYVFGIINLVFINGINNLGGAYIGQSVISAEKALLSELKSATHTEDPTELGNPT